MGKHGLLGRRLWAEGTLGPWADTRALGRELEPLEWLWDPRRDTGTLRMAPDPLRSHCDHRDGTTLQGCSRAHPCMAKNSHPSDRETCGLRRAERPMKAAPRARGCSDGGGSGP